MEKWFFCDYDGTLRNGKDGKVDPKDAKFVRKFIKKGNKFIIASGRSKTMMKKAMEEIGVKPDFYITNAGTVVFDADENLIGSKIIPIETNKKLVKYLESINLNSLIFCTVKDEYYLYTDKVSKYDDGTPKRKNLNKEYDFLMEKEVISYKIQEPRKKLDEIIEYIKINFPKLTIVNNTDTNLIEIQSPKSSKGYSIEFFKEKYNLKPEQIIVAGDDDNDIDMLDWNDNSFVIKQDYNERILKHGKYIINNLYEIKKYLKTKK